MKTGLYLFYEFYVRFNVRFRFAFVLCNQRRLNSGQNVGIWSVYLSCENGECQ